MALSHRYYYYVEEFNKFFLPGWSPAVKIFNSANEKSQGMLTPTLCVLISPLTQVPF